MLVAQASEQYVDGDPYFSNMEKIIKELEGLPFPAAQIELKRIKSLLNKPIEMAFTATNGDEVDLAKMKGKVVLVDFGRLGAVPARSIARYQRSLPGV